MKAEIDGHIEFLPDEKEALHAALERLLPERLGPDLSGIVLRELRAAPDVDALERENEELYDRVQALQDEVEDLSWSLEECREALIWKERNKR